MTRTNKLRRPSYAFGGIFDLNDEDKANYAQTAGIGASMGSGILDAVSHRNDFGNASTASMMGSSALKGVAMGSQFGPLGSIVGGVAGGALGFFQGRKLRREEADANSAMQRDTLLNQNNYSAALIGANPELVNGVKGASVYAGGGDLRRPTTTTNTSGTATFHPEAYSSFGNKAQQAFDQGWMPATSDAQHTTYRNRYGLLNKVVVPGDTRPGSVGIISNGSKFDVMAMNADGKPFGEKMVAGGSYDDVDHYFSSNGNVIGQRSNQILKTPDNTSVASRFATGGSLRRPNTPLATADTEGGTAQPLSSDSVQFNGNSHDQGGIQLPQVGAEVEDGETAKGSYVFSKELGFAKLHRPVAKAIGKIEQKPQTPDRVAAINLLHQREMRLMKAQELHKQLNSIA
jgi:hypothetical protein